MNQKINFIIPYFGKLPNYFQLFLNSCEYNPKFHWTILTDDKTAYRYPANVTCIYMTYEELVSKIQDKFDFKISLEKPYKLCDFKPAYGYLFPELNAGYDYWGYCDVDVIYGNIEKFFSKDMWEFPKIFCLGHFTLIKNEEKYNTMFLKTINGESYYQKVFSSKEACTFDERNPYRPNIDDIFQLNGEKVYHANVIADVYAPSSDFKLVNESNVENKNHSFFLWDKGTLKRYLKLRDTIKEEEYMYIHLQKRKMNLLLSDNHNDVFKIIPNAFEPLEVERENISTQFHQIKLKYWNMNYFKVRYANLKTKIRRKFHPSNKI